MPKRSGLWIAIGLAAALLVDGRGPLAGARAGDAAPARQPSPDAPVEPSADGPAVPDGGQSELPATAGPRDLLRSHGVGDRHFEGLIDGRPLSKDQNDDEHKTLLRVLFWICDFPMVDVERWARQELNLAELVKAPDPRRGEIFSLSGRARLVEVCPLEPDAAKRFEMKRYYRCEFMLDDGQPAVIYTRKVPEKWQQARPIDQPAGAFGMFLKFAGQDTDRPVPVFAAARIAWYPPTRLGELGMDVGLLDDVVNRTALGRARRTGSYDVEKDEALRAADEREAFYAMLGAVGRASPGQLLRDAEELLREAPDELKQRDRNAFSMVPLFKEPEKQQGRLVVLEGTAREVVRVRVDDPDIRARFGIDHYYNIFLFIDEPRVRDSLEYPLVFCVRELPKGMPTGEGPEYGEHVRVAGFFFKLWTYPVAPPDEAPGGPGAPRQLASLLIGRQPVWYPQRRSLINPTAGAVAGGLFVLAILIVWLVLWRSGRGDKRFHDQTLTKAYSVDSGTSLTEIGADADGAPDFSRPGKIDQKDDVGKDG